MRISQKVRITRRRRRAIKGFRPNVTAISGWTMGSIFTIILATILAILGVTFGAAYSVYASFAVNLPDPTAIETEQENFETTKIYDRTGQTVLYELFDPRLGDRSYVTIDQIPETCINAIVSLEDKNFYQNLGFDPEGIARAFWQNLQGGAIQGGSSITQQLIKNIIIEEERRTQKSYTRKIEEVILSVEITRQYPKNQILEWYFNTNHYGNLAYGIEAAAQVYFRKPASALTLAECTMLMPIPNFPAYNPVNDIVEAKKRQGIALARMVEEGYITTEEAEAAFETELEIRDFEERFDIIAPHFAIYARDELLAKFDPVLIYRGGLKVFTTVDLDLNEQAQRIAAEQVAELKEGGHNASNACVVSVRPKTGEILAMIGSIDYWDEENDGNVNVCIANRQPGSSFKPFNYMTALEQGVVTPATMIMDVRQSFPDNPNPPYVPENYDREYHGPVRLRHALARSYNIPAVWVMQKSGVKNVIRNAHKMGITTLNDDFYGLSLTLGGGEVKALDMAYAYGVFANTGQLIGEPRPEAEIRPGHRTLDPVAILRIEDANGDILYEYNKPTSETVVDPALAYLMTDIMSDDRARSAAFGANSDLTLPDRLTAAKTGTTNNFRDNWTIGFTPQLVTAVWVGNNNNDPMEDVTGLSGAAPIWNEVMAYYHQGKPAERWTRPAGLIDVAVDPVSGLLPTEYSRDPVVELFLQDSTPKQEDDVHQIFSINTASGKLAVAGCTPIELVEERVYEIYPPVANDWLRANNIPQPPREYDDNCAGGLAAGPVAITYPRQFEYIQGSIIITGNAYLDGFQLYRFEYGQGLNPQEWFQVGGDHFNSINNGPMEFWDTSALEEGLYTLQLTVLRGDSSFERYATQVTVDHTPPIARIVNPAVGRVYVLEQDEYINLQVDSRDNFAMDRVEYYIDNEKVSETTIAPYSIRWPLVMTDTDFSLAQTVTAGQPLYHPDGNPVIGPDGQIVYGSVITLSEVSTYTIGTGPNATLGYKQVFSGGLQIISDTVGYTETHFIHVIAYDSAGNKIETDPIPVSIIHEEEEEEEDETSSFIGDKPRGLTARIMDYELGVRGTTDPSLWRVSPIQFLSVHPIS
ncbi:MAG: transglycosylase domain-containing protein [Chloroflexota bacterium]